MTSETGTVENRLERIVAGLRERGGRVTPQRLAILRALLTQEHPTVDEIYRQVAQGFPTTSVATVYRTLATLKEMGEVLEVNGADPVAHYDGHRPYRHSHLVCISCGRVVDPPPLDMADLVADLGQSVSDWQIREEAEFYGVCPACRKKAVSAKREGGD